MRQILLKLGIIVTALILVFLGVRFLAIPNFIITADSLHIVVTEVQLPSSSQRGVFDQQFSHQASEVYTQLTSGVPYDNSHIASCPGISNQLPFFHYQLTFFHLGIKVATATSDANGCAAFAVLYPDGSIAYYSWETDSHVSFWTYLHRLVDAPLPINTYVSSDN